MEKGVIFTFVITADCVKKGSSLLHVTLMKRQYCCQLSLLSTFFPTTLHHRKKNGGLTIRGWPIILFLSLTKKGSNK